MSFDVIRKNNPTAAALLRLLSFLNPDGILVQFLTAGAQGLQDDLKQLVCHCIKFQKARIDLERFSLVKRDGKAEDDEMVVIHRLVQAIVKDQMSKDDLRLVRTMTNEICESAFPRSWDVFEDRVWCRLLVTQVIGPLSDTELLESDTSARTLLIAGRLLQDDGKFANGEKPLTRSCKILEEISGSDGRKMLTARLDIAFTHWIRGNLTEAARLEEKVLEKQQQILGAEHPDTEIDGQPGI